MVYNDNRKTVESIWFDGEKKTGKVDFKTRLGNIPQTPKIDDPPG